MPAPQGRQDACTTTEEMNVVQASGLHSLGNNQAESLICAGKDACTTKKGVPLEAGLL